MQASGNISALLPTGAVHAPGRYFHLRDAQSHQQIEKVTFFKTLSEAVPEGGTLPSSPAA
jgi:hypothetical protein